MNFYRLEPVSEEEYCKHVDYAECSYLQQAIDYVDGIGYIALSDWADELQVDREDLNKITGGKRWIQI